MTFNYRTKALLLAVFGWLILAGSAAWAAESVASLSELLGDKSPAGAHPGGQGVGVPRSFLVVLIIGCLSVYMARITETFCFQWRLVQETGGL